MEHYLYLISNAKFGILIDDNKVAFAALISAGEVEAPPAELLNR